MEEEFDYIDGWNGGVLGGRLQREGICLHIWLFHDVIEQKLERFKKFLFYVVLAMRMFWMTIRGCSLSPVSIMNPISFMY